MSTLGTVALVLAALVVAVVFLLARVVRRSPGEEPRSPRTVADLVRMRAEQAADATAAEVQQPDAEPVDAEPVVVEAEPLVVGSPVEPAPAVRVGSPVEPAPAVRADAPAVAQIPGSDTPWGRAVRMTAGHGAVWATGEPNREWSEPVDRADVDESASGAPERSGTLLRPVVLPAVSPELFGPRPLPTPARADPAPKAEAVAAVEEVPAPVEPLDPRPVLALVRDAPAAAPEAEPSDPDPASDHDADPEESAVRRRTATETAAEQAAADLALRRTFGGAPAASHVDDGCAPMCLSVAAVAAVAAAPVAGAAQAVVFRVIGRDGDGIDGAGVTLLDDHGCETTAAVADAKGRGEVRAPRPGGYVLVSSAPGHQPGVAAVTVGGEPVEVEVLLTRSASVAGTVYGEDGPIVGARLTLVQDGEIVDTADTGADGEYRISDLAAGDYGLSVGAHDCEPVALLLTVPDGTDLRHDVELVPAGLPAAATAADHDVMIGGL
jgi:hypothetical protein